ncbi:protein CURLY FLAG LEAF 1-like [Cornus florida]|uniref:protein CURLY FLAG LEAF 1-like n=1 Tax=Cornus florida TaxID=4283 RepID=UPI00289DA10D|nr:protein CURLY FLAG LEAF 1-like [Cornus florida]
MVSFHTPLSPTKRNTIPELIENLSKKRKLEDTEVEEVLQSPFKAKSLKSTFKTDQLRLETPLPLDWQRCLDIKSGHIHFYNTRTHKRTSKDPRLSPEPPSSPSHMSLDLELNLPCGSVTKNPNSGSSSVNDDIDDDDDDDERLTVNSTMKKKKNSGGLTRIPSWLAFEGGDEREMVTAVCKRCHMLVMMCKSSPACPNCKFMHPITTTTDQSPCNSSSFNHGLSLLC